MTLPRATAVPEAADDALGAHPERANRVALLLDRTSLAIGLVILVQAIWFTAIMAGGWYTEADLPNLGAATDHALSWQYLSGSVGGHFGAPGRFLYWVLNRTAPLSWALTIAIRVVLQAVATLLLWRLLLLLVGRRPWLVVLVLLYALNPLLVPGLAWLTSGLGLAAGQVTVLLMLIAHVRYTRGGRLRWAVLTPMLALLSLALADQTLCCLILLPLLSLGFLHTGSLRQRLAGAGRRWPGWVGLVIAMLAFAAFYLSGSYNTGTNRFGAAAAWSIARSEWLEVFGPAFAGGPWRWAWNPHAYVAYSTPSTAAVLTGQLVFFVLLVLSFRVRGWQAVLAWAIPAAIAISGVILVGRGRYDVLGTFVSPLLRYSFYLALALPIGAALAFAPALDEVPETEPVTITGPKQPSRPQELPAWLIAAGVVAMLGASLLSSAVFADRYWKNSSHAYVTNLLASARAGGPRLNVYDTDARPDVMSFLEPNHYISDILGLAGVPVRYGSGDSEPLVADTDGRLVPAVFYRSADAAGPGRPGCGTYIHGAGDFKIRLSTPLTGRDWFLRLELYQPHANTFTVSVQDAYGKSIPLAGDAKITAASKLVTVIRRLSYSSPVSVSVHSGDPATNFCLVHTFVGVPLPKAKQ